MPHKKVAVVTGSNKGIGYAIVKGLCQKFPGDIYLTARDEKRGSDAVKSLNESGLFPKFHLLDVSDNESIVKFRDHLIQEYGGLDILVNNAGIDTKKAESKELFFTYAEETIRINYFGLKNVCEILFPILRSHARVVNISSSFGQLFLIPGVRLRKKFSSETLTESELSELMYSYLEAIQKGTCKEQGWGNSPDQPYAVSKVGVSVLSRIQQKKFLLDKASEDIVVNSVHPGSVKTDLSEMTKLKGVKTIDEGAEAPLYAALLPKNISEPKGDYIWSDKRTVDWINESILLNWYHYLWNDAE